MIPNDHFAGFMSGLSMGEQGILAYEFDRSMSVLNVNKVNPYQVTLYLPFATDLENMHLECAAPTFSVWLATFPNIS